MVSKHKLEPAKYFIIVWALKSGKSAHQLLDGFPVSATFPAWGITSLISDRIRLSKFDLE